jgi:hypothetical protein
MTEPAPGAMLPPDPDPLADEPEPTPADDGKTADDTWHDAESAPPPDDVDDDEPPHAADPEFVIGGEG